MKQKDAVGRGYLCCRSGETLVRNDNCVTGLFMDFASSNFLKHLQARRRDSARAAALGLTFSH